MKVTCKLFPEPTKVTISKVKTVTRTGESGDLDVNLKFWLTGSELVARSWQRYDFLEIGFYLKTGSVYLKTGSFCLKTESVYLKTENRIG